MIKAKLEQSLAMERTLMSSERTMLSQLRTAFASLLLGIALVKLFTDDATMFLGWFFNILGGAMIVISITLYPLRNKRIMNRYR